MSKKKVFDPIMIGLMFNFLKNLYPVLRIKSKKKFRRGVNFNGINFVIPRDSDMVYSKLFYILKELYSVGDAEINYVLKSYYKF
jgi:hypothetical protein